MARRARPAHRSRRPHPRRGAGRDGRDPRRSRDARADRRVRRRAADEGRDRRRARRVPRRDARRRGDRRGVAGGARAARRRRAAPAAIAATRSTCRRSPRSSSPGAGVPVCKHGNRAASSSCGAADLLEALGVVLELDADGRRPLHRGGRHRVLLRAAVPSRAASRGAVPSRARRSRPRSTSSGPLANPARARRQLVGVSDPSMADRMLGRARRPRLEARAARPRSRRPRRAHHDDDFDGARARGRRRSARGCSTRRTSASRSRRPRIFAAAIPRRTQPSPEPCLAGETGPPPRRRRCSTRVRHSSRPAPQCRSPRASPSRRSRSTKAKPRRRSTVSWQSRTLR